MSEPVPKVTAMQLDVNQLATQIAAAILFLVPGLNATWVIERLSGPTRLKGTERLLRALSWSALIYLPSGFWLLDCVAGSSGRGPSRPGS